MNIKNIKKYAFGLAVVAGITVTGVSTAEAQNGQRRGGDRQSQARQQDQRQRNGGYDQVDVNGNIDRNQNGIDDRYESRDGRVDINQNGIADQDENYARDGRNRGTYGNNGSYGNRGYDNNNGEFQKGYRDGLNRGRQDAQTNRARTPNNSSHYQKGNAAYRAGFERGFNESYRQFSGRRW